MATRPALSPSPTDWNGQDEIIKSTFLDRNQTEKVDCNLIILKVCTVAGVIIAAIGIVALMGVYEVEAASLTSVFQKAALLTNEAAFFIGTNGMTLAWTVTAMGTAVFMVGFFGWWVSCCHPSPQPQKNWEQPDHLPSHNEKAWHERLKEKIDKARGAASAPPSVHRAHSKEETDPTSLSIISSSTSSSSSSSASSLSASAAVSISSSSISSISSSSLSSNDSSSNISMPPALPIAKKTPLPHFLLQQHPPGGIVLNLPPGTRITLESSPPSRT